LNAGVVAAVAAQLQAMEEEAAAVAVELMPVV
jgi:hypothetical protein